LIYLIEIASGRSRNFKDFFIKIQDQDFIFLSSTHLETKTLVSRTTSLDVERYEQWIVHRFCFFSDRWTCRSSSTLIRSSARIRGWKGSETLHSRTRSLKRRKGRLFRCLITSDHTPSPSERRCLWMWRYWIL